MKFVKEFQVVILAAVLGLILFAPHGLLAPTEAVAEAEVAEEAVIEEEAVPEEETLGMEETMPTVEITATGLISFDFREAPIRDVLRLFASQVNVNIVTTPSVTGSVNMKLDNVKWQKALELILDVNKLKMTEDKENNIISVMTEAEVATALLEMKIYALNYLQAADYELETDDGQPKTVPGAVTMLKPLIAENETIEADTASNKLIVHATPTTHEMLKSAIDDLDEQVEQVLIEVKFIEASTEAGKELGIKWDFLREYGVEATGLSRIYDKSIGKTFDTSRSESDIGRRKDQLFSSGVDQRDYERSSSLGVSRDYLDALNSYSRDITGDLERSLSWDRPRTDATNILKTATLSAGDVRLVLSALLEDADAKLVSNPRISTVDNKQATIEAVEKFPIPRWTFSADTGTWEVQGFDFEKIGIKLKVTPHINEGNLITLDVDPEVSSRVGEVTFGGGGGGTAEIPIIDTRTARTRVIVKSGETLIIGGLVRTNDIIKQSGVPLLKDIPLVGNIFKHTSKRTENLDLMIFITPTIVKGQAASILAPPPEYVGTTSTEIGAEAPAASVVTE